MSGRGRYGPTNDTRFLFLFRLGPRRLGRGGVTPGGDLRGGVPLVVLGVWGLVSRVSPPVPRRPRPTDDGANTLNEAQIV